MAFRKDPPTIPMHLIQWEETGDESNPKARLLAHIQIGDVDMHLEAWQVYDDDVWGQRAEEASLRAGDFERLGEIMDCTFTTTTIDGREYVLVATPYGT